MLISLSKLINEDVKNTVKIAYPGRFQPFSPHHLEVYENFASRYGKDNVYIVTTNKTNDIDSPFNFTQKKEIMKALGVPFEKIVEVKNTYAPIVKNNLTPGWEKVLNPGDKLIVVIGEKDNDRLKSGTYYRPFTIIDKMEDYTKHAYTMTYKADAKFKDIATGKIKELNGTTIRNIFTDKSIDRNKKYQQFKSIYKISNKKLFDYMYKILNTQTVTESVIAEGIKHIEDLKPNELLDLLSSWNIDNKKFEITEKVDGQSLHFGMNNDGFYVSSKTKQFKDVEEYPPLYFYDTFRKYHSLLQEIDFIDIVGNVIGDNEIEDVKFTGEAIATYDSNIILYDKSIIGDGVYIVFGIVEDGVKLDNAKLKAVCDEINKQSEITFYPNFVVDAKNIKFEEKYITTLRTIIEKYGNILSKPVRNPIDKALKEKVKKIINLIGKKSKETFLGQMSNYKSGLGGDVEGFVVKLPDGNLVKFVDKNKFTAENIRNWKYMEGLNNSYRQFKTELKKNTSLKVAFDKLSKNFYELYDQFRNSDDSEFTIPKKKQDTIESFKIHFKRLDKIKSLLGVEDDGVLINKILNKQLGEALVVEGGKTFPDMKAIKNEYVVPTTRFCLANLGMSKLEYALTGNYKKPMLGDIDLGVDSAQLAQIIGSKFDTLEDKDKFFTDLKSYIEANKTDKIIDYKINKGLQQFSVAVAAVDDKNNFIPDTNVQLDVMIGDREWMRRALGPAVESKYKAAHRNFLYTAAFSQIEMETGQVDIKRKYQFNMKQGVETVDFTFDGKGKRVKIGKNLITGNVDDMVHILFDESVKFEQVNSFEELYRMMLTDKFKYPELRDDIFKEFVTTVKNMKLPVPDEMKKYE